MLLFYTCFPFWIDLLCWWCLPHIFVCLLPKMNSFSFFSHQKQEIRSVKTLIVASKNYVTLLFSLWYFFPLVQCNNKNKEICWLGKTDQTPSHDWAKQWRQTCEHFRLQCGHSLLSSLLSPSETCVKKRRQWRKENNHQQHPQHQQSVGAFVQPDF